MKITVLLATIILMVTFVALPAFAQKQVVTASDAPKAIGPYSHAVKANGFIFTSGQIAFDPKTMQLVQGDVSAQTDRVLKNIQAILTAAGTDFDHVVKATVFLKNISDYAAMNEVYGKYFKSDFPARTTVQVAALPKDALVEIEVVALLGK